MPRTLSTKRLLLRPLAGVDAAWLASTWRMPEIYRYAASIPPDVDTEFAHERIRQANEGEEAGTMISRLIEIDDNRAGMIGLGRSHRGEAYSLGYHLHPDFWSQGIMTEAGTALLEWTDTFIAPRYYVSGHFADNPKSSHVLRKLGFMPCWRSKVFSAGRNENADHVYMSRLVE